VQTFQQFVALWLLPLATALCVAELRAQEAGRELVLTPLLEEVLGEERDAHPLDVDRWLIAGAGGLHLYTQGSLTLLRAGHFEALDARSGLSYQGRAAALASMIDVGSGDVHVLLLDEAAGDLLSSVTLRYAGAFPETQCLFLQPATGHVSLFTVDARGKLGQRYVYDGDVSRLVDVPVREDIGVPGAQACAVHDTSGSLMIAEESVGVWRYEASEESDPTRTPVLLRAPWGELAGDIEDIAVDRDGGLWALVPERRIYHRALANDVVVEYALPDGAHAETIAVTGDATSRVVSILDDASGRHYLSTVNRSQGAEVPVLSAGSVLGPGTIMAHQQTAPVSRYGDAADDPAILVASGGDSALILATDKRRGLAAYDLDGRLQQFLPVGRVNNVDILPGLELGGQLRTIAAASNRSGNSISLFSIEGSDVAHLADLPTDLEEVYGLCVYGSSSGAYVFINGKSGRYQQYRLSWENNAPGAALVREFSLPSQPEGCAADPVTGRIFMGEEAAGVWVAGAEPDGDAPELVIPTSDALVADVEGMDIYRSDSAAYLVVSSQGSDSFAVYRTQPPYALAGRFRITVNLQRGVDGVSETDGLAVSASALPGYPRGILVVQDGRNRMPDAPQNFKIIDWRAVEAVLSDDTQQP
jgi:3-phytase